MDALIVSDLHYVRVADHVCTIPERHTSLALDLCQQAYETLCKQGFDLDLAIVLGDVVDDGTAVGADRDLEEVSRTMRAWQIPVLAVTGNHDGDGVRFAEIFGRAPGLNVVGDVGFLLFEDSVGEGHVTTRPEDSVIIPGQVAALSPGKRLVALQHNPIYPPIDREYPYLLSNADAVVESYREAGVLLSLSGHYHPGQPPSQHAGVTFYTAPALCEEPFRFAHLQIEGQTVAIQEFDLQ